MAIHYTNHITYIGYIRNIYACKSISTLNDRFISQHPFCPASSVRVLHLHELLDLTSRRQLSRLLMGPEFEKEGFVKRVRVTWIYHDLPFFIYSSSYKDTVILFCAKTHFEAHEEVDSGNVNALKHGHYLHQIATLATEDNSAPGTSKKPIAEFQCVWSCGNLFKWISIFHVNFRQKLQLCTKYQLQKNP